jgi:amino acid transporter
MRNDSVQQNNFGTFGGVFIPNILTILGVVLFLRFGWIVGQAGVYHALMMVLIGSLVTLLTSLSLSAAATNIRVKAGGAYYLISRSLGIEIGGAIGIPLYLSQTISVAFYLIGFSEAFCAVFPELNSTYVAGFICIIFGFVAYWGADFAVKLQFLILGILCLSLCSFFWGARDFTQPLQLVSSYTDGYNFWVVFAIFFPAVTGIMAGVSMSGDLKNPDRSIPSGTLSAVIISWFVYSLVVIFISGNVPVSELLQNRLAMKDVFFWSPLFDAGIWAAALSSGLASIVSAPRILQAMANDRVVPYFMGRRLGSPTEPRMGVLLTFVIAFSVIMLGNLDLVAPVITMFFLNTYGMLNLAAGIEKLAGNPSFRPRININGWLSMLGALLCYGIMFLIHVWATVVAIFLSFFIYLVLKKKTLRQNWGDARSGLWSSVALFALRELENYTVHVKNWKPNILVFTGNPSTREDLIRLCNWLEAGNGMISIMNLIIGPHADPKFRKLQEVSRRNIKQYVQENRLAVFGDAALVDSFGSGVRAILQHHGVGRLRANIALFGCGSNVEQVTNFLEIVPGVLSLPCSLLMLHVKPDRGFGDYSRIDVWWDSLDGDGSLMMILAHLLLKSDEWRNAGLRVLKKIDSADGVESATRNLNELFAKMRFKVDLLVFSASEPMEELISDYAVRSSLSIIGMQSFMSEENSGDAALHIFNITTACPGACLFVHNSEERLINKES